MIEDVSEELGGVTVPVTIIIGDRDQVEHEAALRRVFARYIPHAKFLVLQGIGHLSPLEGPDTLADACKSMIHSLRGSDR
jgi:pimeloyl-ACP methyl ester carboxylesterase